MSLPGALIMYIHAMNIEDRVRRLESQNRFLMYLLIAAVVAAGAAVVNAADPVPGLIKGNKIVLSDASGAPRVTLLATKDGGSIWIDDAKGETMIRLSHGIGIDSPDNSTHVYSSLRVGQLNAGHAISLQVRDKRPTVKIMDGPEEKPTWVMPAPPKMK